MKAWYQTLTLGTLVALAACTGDDTVTPMDTEDSSSSGSSTTASGMTESTSGPTTSEETSIADTSSESTSTSTSTPGTETETETETETGGGRCGDDIVDGRDVCDGADLDGQDCVTQGFDGGELACAADCAGFDTSGCTSLSCGDDIINGKDVCDGTDLGGETCASQGAGAGILGCAADCTGFDTSGCMAGGGGPCCQAHLAPECDDAPCTAAICEADPFCCETQWDEFCASAALNEPVCEGAAGCPTCGDGTLEPGEVCDGVDLGGATCESQGFGGGTLGCSDDCTAFDVSACEAEGACCSANGTVGCEDGVCMAAVCAFDPFCCDTMWDELCADGAILEPACQGASDCPNCGNGELEGVEPCDGDNLGGQTCESQGYVSGTLACATNCLSFDETACQGEGACCAENGTVGCENMACTTAVCELDPSCCDVGWSQGCADLAATTAACQGLAGCPNCGNATLEDLEVCDGDNLDGQSCASLGLNAGTLACSATCLEFDTTGCFAGACCAANGSPNCEDEGCSAAICAFDSFCCEVEWDDICASAAAAEAACVGVGGCP